jgi:phosphotriesterase-related protein
MAYVRTVLGDIQAEELGLTYTHEHLICHPPEWKIKEDPDLELPDVEKAIEELEFFYKAGGQALVEGTAIDYGREAGKLKYIANKVPVHIIATTGFNKGAYYPDWVKEKSIDELAEIMIKEINIGIESTGVRAGQIKIGSSYNVITDSEIKVTKAAARAQKATGAPMWIHTESGTMGLEQVEILEEEGADLSAIAVGHSDRNADPYYHLQLAKKGVYIQFDGIGKVKYYPDSVRVFLIKNLLAHGYERKILISGDMGRKSYLKSYGGGPGFEFIIRKFIPRLLAEGIDKEIIQTIFVKNPAKWLARF